MAHGGADKYYNPTNKVVYDGDTANASDLNAINTAADSAFEQVADDLDSLEANQENWELSSEKWATDPVGTNPDPIKPTKYSSEANASESENWASSAVSVIDSAGDDTGEKSAKTLAAEAVQSADDAQTSANLAASLITNADDVAGSAPIKTTSVPDGSNFDLTIEIDGIDGISTDGTLAGNSDTKLPSEKAVKTYADAGIDSVRTDWVEGVTAGDNVTVDNTDPQNPIIASIPAAQLTWEIVSASATAVVFEGYLVDVSGGVITMTLPAAPSEGDLIGFTDLTGEFEDYNLTLGRNSLNIMGLAEDLTVDVNYTAIILCYSDATNGWKILSCTPV